MMDFLFFLEIFKGQKVSRKEFIPRVMSLPSTCSVSAHSDWLVRPDMSCRGMMGKGHCGACFKYM